jgi:hypothetical protein
MQTIVAGMVMALLVCPSGTYAQDVGRVESASPHVQATAVASPGMLSKAVTREAANLGKSRTGLVAQAPQSGQKRRWSARHPVLAGALIGAGAGAVVGAVTSPTRSDDFVCNIGPCSAGGYSALGAGVFGGIGALVGLAF